MISITVLMFKHMVGLAGQKMVLRPEQKAKMKTDGSI